MQPHQGQEAGRFAHGQRQVLDPVARIAIGVGGEHPMPCRQPGAAGADDPGIAADQV